MTQWTTDRIPDQHGRVVVITGANGGLGFEAARILAAKGATVVMACRSPAKGETARQEIIRLAPGSDIHVAGLDTSILSSVETFAARTSAEFPHIDLLINNAGIMATPRARSADGFELQLATNHLGHFALTARLLPQMLVTPGSRVVAIASIAAQSGRIDFEDLMGEKHYDKWKAYNQSKLANLMFAFELQRRLAAIHAQTIAVCAHPGASITNLFSTPGADLVKRVLSPLMRFMFQPASQGVLPVLYAATAADAKPGGYYGPDGFKEMKGWPTTASVPRQALDQSVALQLWEESEKLVSLRYPL